MDNLFLDTSALVELFRGSEKGRRVLDSIRGATVTFTSSLNLYELWYLAAGEKGEVAADNAVLSVGQLAHVVEVDAKISIAAAKLKFSHKGKKIGAVDFVTAASAIEAGALLLTGDYDFKEIGECKLKMI